MIHRTLCAVGLLAALTLATPTFAHIVFHAPQGAASGYYAGVLRVSHACGASPTRSIRVEIPAGVVTARPQPKPGWSLSIEHQPLAEPIRGEGGSLITQRVSAITWTGNLPADQFDQFGIMFRLPQQAGPLYFPTRQTCASGRNDWVNIPATPEAWHETAMPAPMLLVADEHAMHGH